VKLRNLDLIVLLVVGLTASAAAPFVQARADHRPGECAQVPNLLYRGLPVYVGDCVPALLPDDEPTPTETATPLPSDTPAPTDTDTPVPPTDTETPVPPTETMAPPTETPAPVGPYAVRCP
jgi:hypothetical protein